MEKYVKLIEENREKIAARLKELYRACLENAGESKFTLYIWDDGELETLEDVQGGSLRYVSRDSARELFHIATIEEPFFCWQDFLVESVPDDEEEKEELRQEVIDCLVYEYDPELVIDIAIENEKEIERWS